MNTLATSDVFAALHPLLLLAVGIAVIAIIAELVARRMTDARRTRGFWQVAIIAMFSLAALELTGGATRLISALLPAPTVNDEVASDPVEETALTDHASQQVDWPSDTDEPLDQSVQPRDDTLPTNPTHTPFNYPTRKQGTERTDIDTALPSNRVHHEPHVTDIEPKRPATEQPVRWPSEAVDKNSRKRSRASESHRTEARRESTPALTAGPAVPPTIPPLKTSSDTTTTLFIGGILLASACITLLLLVRIAIGRLRLFWFRRRLPRVTDADLLECVRRLRIRFKLRQSIELRESDAVTAPIAFGIWRPTIVLPPEFAPRTTREQQKVVLAHEVTHLAGGDSAWQLAADLLAAVLWWHPGVWFARKRLHAACEWVADESSSVVPHGPDILAECLVAIGKSMRPSRRLAWLSAQGGECQSALARRVERLLNMSTRRRTAKRRGSTSGKFLLALVLTTTVVFCTAWARPGLETTQGAENMSNTTSSWKQCVAAAVVAVFGTNEASTSVAADAPDETQLLYVFEDGDGDREHRDRERGERDRPRRDGDRDREHREGDRDRPNPERVMRELRGRMEALKREAHKIRERLEKTENREGEEAKYLERKLLEIELRMRATRAYAEAAERRLHQKAVSRRIEQLQREHARLKEAGRHEEAELVAREAREIMRVVERERERPRRESEQREHHREEAHRRLEHLHRAIENLHEAGLEDQARRLAEQAERIERELGGRRDRPRRHEEEGHNDHKHAEHLEREVHELREEMQDLRNELREMRRAFREVIEELEDHNEEDDDEEELDEDDEDDEDEE